MPQLIDGIPTNGWAFGEIRRARRKSLADIAQATGGKVSVSYLSEVENGRKTVMSRERLEAVAAALGCASPKALTTEPHLFDPEEVAA